MVLLALTQMECSSHITSPSVPAPQLPNVNTPTPTGSAVVTGTPTLTPANSPTSSSTSTPTSSTTSTPTKSATPTVSLTPSTPTLTPTNSPTSTATGSPTVTPTSTGTFYTPTITPTPVYTGTVCFTFTATYTACVVPTPSCVITGTITYTGAGVVDSNHPLFAGLVGGSGLIEYYGSGVTGGTYVLKSQSPGTATMAAYYDFNGLANNSTNYVTELIYPVPGERYTSTGSCSNPVAINSFPVTFVSGSSAGPSITIDDSCSYWGVYGTASYTGHRGTVQYCRLVNISAYADPAYGTLVQSTSVMANGAAYFMVTNAGSNTTGLTPLYVRAWFDANGDYAFDAGDPYLDLGQVTPTTNGLLENISFDDTNIK
jgi:hypothetical protein